MSDIWTVSYVALWALVLLNTVLVLSAFRHIGILYRRILAQSSRISTLKPERPIPDLELPQLGGSKVRLSDLAGRPRRFVVVTPQCSGCGAALTQVADAAAAAEPGSWTVVGLGATDAVRELVEASGLPDHVLVLVDDAERIRSAWGITGTPVVIEVDAALRVGRQSRGVSDAGAIVPAAAAA